MKRGFYRLGILVLGLVLILLVLAISSRFAERLLIQRAKNDPDVARLIKSSEDMISTIEAFRYKHGFYPCHAEYLPGYKADDFKKSWFYQATIEGFYIYIKVTDTAGIIFYGHPGAPVAWRSCTADSSCPPGSFSEHCYGERSYPKKELLSPKKMES